ncbi:Os06g0217925 [Oryza sativa Japonica Group]|uniref:Os06g0217925 protein n=1 Tax=Oryza sativa subsp. japonica TaxID=39947 RepID=A0A0P0WUJ1_ORYSJ|nr:hypothetical protein EE612_032718 [Oryza sativa]BAS96803.1 Os06g0217925 [Oryza sativa Japonica Group]
MVLVSNTYFASPPASPRGVEQRFPPFLQPKTRKLLLRVVERSLQEDRTRRGTGPGSSPTGLQSKAQTYKAHLTFQIQSMASLLTATKSSPSGCSRSRWR